MDTDKEKSSSWGRLDRRLKVDKPPANELQNWVKRVHNGGPDRQGTATR